MFVFLVRLPYHILYNKASTSVGALLYLESSNFFTHLKHTEQIPLIVLFTSLLLIRSYLEECR